MTKEVLRIGPGVPGAHQRGRRWFGIKPEWVIGAAVFASVSLMVAAVYLFDRPADDADAAAPVVPTQESFQCVTITREYESWWKGRMMLAEVLSRPGAIAMFNMEELQEDGDAFYKVVTGYDDRPSTELAANVATYNVELGMLGFKVSTDGEADPELHARTVEAWMTVEQGYQKFVEVSC